MGLDERLAKLPGSHRVKVLVGVAAILGITAYPIFSSSAKEQQGQNYFSQERPEAIIRAQEEKQRRWRESRKDD